MVSSAITVNLNRHFCKEYGLPINVYEYPYFQLRLCALDSLFDCLQKYRRFAECLKRFDAEQDYFTYYNSVKESAITSIRNNEKFQEFCNMLLPRDIVMYKTQEMYTPQNDGKLFFSVDMKKANFSALHFYSPEIFNNKHTWEDFLGQFTDCEHILNSKYIRQVIMGALNPGRQVKYETMLMKELTDHIVDSIPEAKVYSVHTDEILLEADGITEKTLQEAVNTQPDGIGSLVKIELFQLEAIKGTGGYIKHMYDAEGTKQFKCLPSDIYHQVVKHYNKMEITPEDLVFMHEGKLAAYLEAIENPWKE